MANRSRTILFLLLIASITYPIFNENMDVANAGIFYHMVSSASDEYSLLGDIKTITLDIGYAGIEATLQIDVKRDVYVALGSAIWEGIDDYTLEPIAYGMATDSRSSSYSGIGCDYIVNSIIYRKYLDVQEDDTMKMYHWYTMNGVT